MSTGTDTWFVRFPDGRVLRATSTEVVRQQLGAGRIPSGSTVRRTPDDEWTSPEWVEEFADLTRERAPTSPREGSPAVPPARLGRAPMALGIGEPSGVAARLDPNRLQTVGVRGLVDELIGALDSTLVRKKIFVGVVAAFVLGLLFALAPLEPFQFTQSGSGRDRALAALAVLLVSSVATALLTRMTFVEVSRLRPSRWKESFKGLGGLSFRLAVAQLVVTGNALLVIELLRLLPGFFLIEDPLIEVAPVGLAATIAVVAAMAAEVAQWPVFGLSLLLAPILAVEGCSIGTALLQWWRLVRRHFGRAFVYEALAVGVGLIVTLPLFFPLVAFVTIYQEPRLIHAVKVTRTVLASMALGPLFAYLAVANVFIYLNLRYETTSVKS